MICVRVPSSPRASASASSSSTIPRARSSSPARIRSRTRADSWALEVLELEALPLPRSRRRAREFPRVGSPDPGRHLPHARDRNGDQLRVADPLRLLQGRPRIEKSLAGVDRCQPGPATPGEDPCRPRASSSSSFGQCLVAELHDRQMVVSARPGKLVEDVGALDARVEPR